MSHEVSDDDVSAALDLLDAKEVDFESLRAALAQDRARHGRVMTGACMCTAQRTNNSDGSVSCVDCGSLVATAETARAYAEQSQ